MNIHTCRYDVLGMFQANLLRLFNIFLNPSMVFDFIKRAFSTSRSKNRIPPSDPNIPYRQGLSQTTAIKAVSESAQNDTDYLSLATSFNDFLLGEQSQNSQPLNEVESFIINSLETMLHGDIPDSAVPSLPCVAMALLKELVDVNITPEAISLISISIWLPKC